MSWIRRRHHGWWAAVLLPGLLLRALVPVGFMPMVGPDHRVKLVVCESFAPMPDSMSMDMSMDMDMQEAGTLAHQAGHPHSGGHLPNHDDHGDCPYGSSPALAALPLLSILAVVHYQPSSPAPVASSQIAFSEVSPLAPSPRGPPV